MSSGFHGAVSTIVLVLCFTAGFRGEAVFNVLFLPSVVFAFRKPKEKPMFSAFAGN